MQLWMGGLMKKYLLKFIYFLIRKNPYIFSKFFYEQSKNEQQIRVHWIQIQQFIIYEQIYQNNNSYVKNIRDILGSFLKMWTIFDPFKRLTLLNFCVHIFHDKMSFITKLLLITYFSRLSFIPLFFYCAYLNKHQEICIFKGSR